MWPERYSTVQQPYPTPWWENFQESSSRKFILFYHFRLKFLNPSSYSHSSAMDFSQLWWVTAGIEHWSPKLIPFSGRCPPKEVLLVPQDISWQELDFDIKRLKNVLELQLMHFFPIMDVTHVILMNNAVGSFPHLPTLLQYQCLPHKLGLADWHRISKQRSLWEWSSKLGPRLYLDTSGMRHGWGKTCFLTVI